MLVETKAWQLYFDGVARSRGAKVGIVFVTPAGRLIPYSFSLIEIYSNNVAEYEAFIIGLEVTLEMRIDNLDVFSDSQLIISIVALYQRARILMNQFLQVEVNHVPRSKNDKADALTKLATSLIAPVETEIQITIEK